MAKQRASTQKKVVGLSAVLAKSAKRLVKGRRSETAYTDENRQKAIDAKIKKDQENRDKAKKRQSQGENGNGPFQEKLQDERNKEPVAGKEICRNNVSTTEIKQDPLSIEKMNQVC